MYVLQCMCVVKYCNIYIYVCMYVCTYVCKNVCMCMYVMLCKVR